MASLGSGSNPATSTSETTSLKTPWTPSRQPTSITPRPSFHKEGNISRIAGLWLIDGPTSLARPYSGSRGGGFPFVALRHEARIAHDPVPDDGLKRLSV